MSPPLYIRLHADPSRCCAANFAASAQSNFNDAYATPSNAIFNVLGLSSVPTIAPVLNEVTAVSRFDLYSLWIAPLFADTMTVTFTPFGGGTLLPIALDAGAGAPYSVDLVKGSAPTPVTFPSTGNGTFRGISAVRINVAASNGTVRPPSSLNISMRLCNCLSTLGHSE